MCTAALQGGRAATSRGARGGGDSVAPGRCFRAARDVSRRRRWQECGSARFRPRVWAPQAGRAYLPPCYCDGLPVCMCVHFEAVQQTCICPCPSLQNALTRRFPTRSSKQKGWRAPQRVSALATFFARTRVVYICIKTMSVRCVHIAKTIFLFFLLHKLHDHIYPLYRHRFYTYIYY
jgi:hypothetical protein